MHSKIINYLPDNSSPLPICFNTASTYYKESSVIRPNGQKDYHQILIVVDGTGELKCNNRTYALNKGCAFFTDKDIPVEYKSTSRLITAFITAIGPAIDDLKNYYNSGAFFFFNEISTEKYISAIESIIAEYYEHKRESILSAMVYNLYVDFFEELSPMATDVIDRASLYIEKHFTKRLSLDDIAEQNGISVSKLCHDFKSKFGYTVFEHITNLRLTYARNHLLSSPDAKTVDVATACGYEDVSYFCRAYKKKYNVTPTEDKIKSAKE